jgi:hypothetical protein
MILNYEELKQLVFTKINSPLPENKIQELETLTKIVTSILGTKNLFDQINNLNVKYYVLKNLSQILKNNEVVLVAEEGNLYIIQPFLSVTNILGHIVYGNDIFLVNCIKQKGKCFKIKYLLDLEGKFLYGTEMHNIIQERLKEEFKDKIEIEKEIRIIFNRVPKSLQKYFDSLQIKGIVDAFLKTGEKSGYIIEIKSSENPKTLSYARYQLNMYKEMFEQQGYEILGLKLITPKNVYEVEKNKNSILENFLSMTLFKEG